MFICQTLAEHRLGGFITARGYRAAKTRHVSDRCLHDCELVLVVMDSTGTTTACMGG